MLAKYRSDMLSLRELISDVDVHVVFLMVVLDYIFGNPVMYERFFI